MYLINNRIAILLAVLLVFSLRMYGQENPVAHPQATVVSGNMRFTVLTPEMIRIEWSDTKQFEDRASFIVINRHLPVPDFTAETIDGYLYIKTEKIELRYKVNANPVTHPASSRNLKITFELDGAATYWYPGKIDPFNLKGTLRTLDHSSGDNLRGALEDGLLSRSGWVLIDESKPNGDTSKSLLLENQGGDFDWVTQRNPENKIDWYFMAYGHDYKRALLDFTKVGGKQPMPPLYALGYWYSKYERYTEQDFKDIVNDIKQHDIPIDVMVIDMDWHKEGWTGWSWNTELFPNPQGFIEWLHENNLKTTLNLHPADGVGPHEDNFIALANDLGLPTNETIKWNIEDETFYKYFFKNIMRPHENIGVDFWWLDWQQWLLAPGVDNLGNTFWLNYVFYNDMKHNRPDRRPMIFHRWGGMGNHRYPIGFSGDSWATFSTLAFQIYFNSIASNVAYGYWSHDLGGHNQAGPNDPELYLRWIQFGVFSPIARTHATNAPHIERRIWKYPNFEQMREALKLRYALIPYIYTYSRQAYDTGISLCRPLYYDFPQANEAYKQETSYMFGGEILVSPIAAASRNKIGTSTKQIWLPEGLWMEAETGSVLEGNNYYVRSFAQNEIPYFYKEGAIIPMYPDIKHLQERPDTLIVKFVPGKTGTFIYYEDEGDNDNYQEGRYTTTKIEQNTNAQQGEYTIHPREGAFDNMPVARHYELRLLFKLPPKNVVVDGEVYGYSPTPASGHWSYDGKQLAIVVNLPLKSCDAKIVVQVEYDDKQSDSEDLMDGKVGQMTRLIQCNHSIEVSIAENMPDLFTDLVGVANKITEDPQNTLVLLEYFEENLEASFDLLLEMGNVPSKEISEWKNFILGMNVDNLIGFGGSDSEDAIGYNPDGTNLWITGSAIPGTTAILNEDPNLTPGYFRYYGELLTGEFRIMNTPTIQSNTIFYVPSSDDVNVVGSSSILTTYDAEMPGWNVTIADNSYKIKINATGRILNGEIFMAREDLFIVGGATEVGWDSGRAIRLEKDLNNPNLFVFSGLLKVADTGNDRNTFKLLGQNDWGPVSFHSKTQNESLLESRYIYENLPGDHKWAIDPDKQGVYVIKVDLLKETINARYTDSYLYTVYINGVEWPDLNETYLLDCSSSDVPLNIEIVPLSGKIVDIGSFVEFQAGNVGLNVLEFTIFSQDGINKKSYELKVSKPFEFYDLVTQMWDNTLTVINNPEKNGGYKFVDFEWYEDGRLIGENKQYYSAGRLSTDLLNKNAVYVVKLMDENGNWYQTCPTKLVLEELSQFLVYPSFVQVGETVNVEAVFNAGEYVENNKLNVINLNGSIVCSHVLKGNKASFKAPASGVYLIQLISDTGVQTAKLIVGN